jgi:mono/diheme cytochrome c family protein
MRVAVMVVVVAVGLLAVGGVAAGAFIASGIYNIGADDHHTAPVLALISELRERSIDRRVRDIEVPDLADAARIAAGAHRYATLCVSCHLAPGLNHSDLRTGLYPHPPSLAQQAPPDPRRAFWIIKHGIKMSAMPAWGKTLDDSAVWELVAFVREMPDLTPQHYEALSR